MAAMDGNLLICIIVVVPVSAMALVGLVAIGKRGSKTVSTVMKRVGQRELKRMDE